MRERWSARTRWIVALLCLCAVALIASILPGMMWLGNIPLLSDGAPAEADPLGMLLIDILSDDTAAMYHVSMYGVYVLAVNEPSVAYRAGVRSGDRIVAANGLAVVDTAALSELLTADAPLSLTLMRGERTIRLTINAAD